MDFNLDATYGDNNDINKSRIIKYTPINLETMKTISPNINIILNREDNQLNIHDSYLEIEFIVLDNAGGVFASNANMRFGNYGKMALNSSVMLETSGCRTIENIDHGHPNLLL